MSDQASGLALSADEIVELLGVVFPQARRSWSITELTPSSVSLHQPTDDTMLRPGGTVSGPSQMALMDLAAYVLVLANVGPAELAVTSSMHLSFLRRPRPGVLRCDATLLKLGRSLAVVDALLYCDGPEPVAHGELTYSLSLVSAPPPSAGAASDDAVPDDAGVKDAASDPSADTST